MPCQDQQAASSRDSFYGYGKRHDAIDYFSLNRWIVPGPGSLAVEMQAALRTNVCFNVQDHPRMVLAICLHGFFCGTGIHECSSPAEFQVMWRQQSDGGGQAFKAPTVACTCMSEPAVANHSGHLL